jgi:large subunit ribosomal protein L29
MTVDQLDDELLKLKKEQFNLRFQRRPASSRTPRVSAPGAHRDHRAQPKTAARQKPKAAAKAKAEGQGVKGP